MNKELKEKWVAALRSGNYKQGRRLLRTLTNEFCCLGVLCDLLDKDKWVRESGRNYRYGDDPMEGSCYLPPCIAYPIGITQEEQNRLSVLNDDPESSFTKIADFIERTPML